MGLFKPRPKGILMIAKDAKIAVVGAGAIGGVTAAFIKKAGWNPLLVCKHEETADLSKYPGMRISGIKGDHTVALQAVKHISDLPERQDLVFLATKAYDCLDAAQSLLAFLKPESMVVSMQNGICEKGKALGVPTPLNDAVTAMVLEIENGQKPMTLGNLAELAD